MSPNDLDRKPNRRVVARRLRPAGGVDRVGARGSKGGVSPELDPITRFYAQPTSWATATAAAQYAHAARVFGQIPKT